MVDGGRTMTPVNSERIRQLRLLQGMTKAELAERAGISAAYLGRIERGLQQPGIDVLNRIAAALGVPLTELLSVESTREDPAAVRIPVIGRTHAGWPIFADEVLEGYLSLPPDSNLEGSGRYFALRVQGDSMEPTIPDGSIVIVRQQPTVSSGQIAVVQWADNWETHIRRVHQADGRVILQADNRRYPPLVLTEPKVRVLGRVIKVLVDLDSSATIEPTDT